MPAPVFYSVSMYGTASLEQGSGTITITNGVAVLTEAQTAANIGVGVEIEYNSLHAYIAPNRIGFDAGSTEIKVGDKITDATSGATGIIRFVEVTGGTWGGNDAAGWLYFEKTTGTFGNNNVINITKPTVTNSVAVVNGTIEGNIGNGNTEFVVKSAIGADAANQTSTPVTSIHHVWATVAAFEGAFAVTGGGYINNADLTAADVVAHCCYYYDHDNYTPDSTEATIDETTTDLIRYISIFAPRGGAESINVQCQLGVYDANKALIAKADKSILVKDQYCRIEGLQFDRASESGNASIIEMNAGSAGTGVIINACLFKDAANDASADLGCLRWDYVTTSAKDEKVFNCVFYHTNPGGDAIGIRNLDYAGNHYYYYNTIIGFDVGVLINNSNTSITIKNNVCFANTDGYSSNIDSADYCAYDEGSDPGTNGVNISADAGTDLFEDYNNDNFDVKDSGSSLYEAGTSLLSDANIAVWRDIAGNERGATPDIGAFEYVAGAAGLSIPIAMLQMNQFNGGGIL